MDNREDYNTYRETGRAESRSTQLLQVWRDYYDEIFEVNLKTGAYESLMEAPSQYWSRSGFTEIEVILLAEKSVHPDDKENFKQFFDFERIRECIANKIFVTKLNFRISAGNGEYEWVKVKNIVPTKQVNGLETFFACFRRVDRETGDDMRYKQELSDALASARALNERRNVLLNRVFREVKSPLNGIIGMAGLLKNELGGSEADISKLGEQISKLEAEALSINRVLNQLMSSNIVERDEKAGVQFVDQPVNKISYSHSKEEAVVEAAPEKTEFPEDYAYTTDFSGDGRTNSAEHDFTGKRVLVVEDNELNLEVMKELLESTGAAVDTATDGKQAVISFVSKPAGTYDVVLMDIDLPVMDGYSATRCIRISGKDDSGTVPVYAVTSNNFNEEVQKTYEYGFNAFFTKPVDFTVLFDKMAKDFGD